MSIKTLIADAQAALSKHLSLEPKEARLEAQLLLQELLQVNRAWLLAHEADELASTSTETYQAFINRRLNGEPIAYILGKREFYGLALKVTPATLIPRPDTETLVEATLAKIPQHQKVSILDLGTGTGAIALAIGKERPHAALTAVDASEAALNVAKENGSHLNITNVEFVLSNWYTSLADTKFDMIVSNPPYIEESDAHLQQGDLRFEPRSALASGADGLYDIRHIIASAPKHLRPHGWLMLEHGYNQAEAVKKLLQNSGFTAIEHAYDLAGIARVTFGRI